LKIDQHLAKFKLQRERRKGPVFDSYTENE